MGETGIISKNLSESAVEHSGNAVRVVKAFNYRVVL